MYVPFTLTAYLFNGIAVLIDKYLLTGEVAKPFAYIFYISCFSLIILLLTPFVSAPSLIVFFLASVSTLLWTSGAYFLYRALQVGIASRVVPVIGTLIPTLLLVEAILVGSISLWQIIGVIFLIGGLILITFRDWRGEIHRHEFIFEVLSSLLFAVSYIVLREAYVRGHFLTVLVYSRLVLLPVVLVILAVPFLRSQIQFGQKKSYGMVSKAGMLFLFGQFCGGISELLLTYSVSLVPPALVNSLQGVQYGFLYIANFVLSKKKPDIYKEEKSVIGTIFKIVGIVCISIGLLFLGGAFH